MRLPVSSCLLTVPRSPVRGRCCLLSVNRRRPAAKRGLQHHTSHGTADLPDGLTAREADATVFPVAAVVTAAVRTRRMEWIGTLSLASIALGIAGVLVLRDPHVLLVKDSLISGRLGLAFLLSLLASKPLTLSLPARSTPPQRRRSSSGGRALPASGHGCGR